MGHPRALVVWLVIIIGTTFKVAAHEDAGLAPAAASDIDLTFNAGPLEPPTSLSRVRAVAVQADGKVVIGGDFTGINGAPRRHIARLNDDGSLDTTFVPVLAGGIVTALILQPDGKILVGGQFSLLDGSVRACARLNSDGSLDSSFSVTTTGSGVFAMALQPDDKIIIAGHLGQVDGISGYTHLARLNPDSSLDTSLAPGVVPSVFVNAVALQPDGKIVAGGDGGGFFVNLFRLNSDGTPDSSFDVGSGPNNPVYAIDIQPDGGVLVAGGFGSINGIPHNSLARLNEDGSDDSSFGPSILGGSILAMTLQPDGQILIGGGFVTVNGIPRHNIARLTTAGELDAFAQGLSPGSAGGNIFSIALQPDGKVLIGGEFEAHVGGETRWRIVRLENDLF